jgi:hypothetical protein
MEDVTELPQNDPVYVRLEKQLDWYGKKSRSARLWFQRIKLIEIVSAALIPLLAGRDLPNVRWIVAGLGLLITLLEGILHLYQFQERWSSYRVTAEALKREKFLYLGNAGPYAEAQNPKVLLAERVEAVIAQENVQWQAAQQKVTQATGSSSQTEGSKNPR